MATGDRRSSGVPESPLGRINDWNDVQFLLAAARSGSFAAAAEKLGTTQATLSRRIEALERRAGTRLFRRDHYGIALTDPGRALMDTAMDVEHAATAFDRLLAAGDRARRRDVLLTAEVGMLSYLLMPELPRFYGSHPEIKLRLSFVDDYHIFPAEADLAIVGRMPGERPFSDPDIVVAPLGHVSLLVHAGRSRVGSRHWPKCGDDLIDLPLLHDPNNALDKTLAPWNRLVYRNRTEGASLVTDVANANTRFSMLAGGAGFGLCSTFSRFIDERLVPVPVGLPLLQIAFYLATHRDVLRFAAVQSVWDFVTDLFTARGAWFEDQGNVLDTRAEMA